jgi:hypothetical protein
MPKVLPMKAIPSDGLYVFVNPASNPLITQDRNSKDRCRTSGIKVSIVAAIKREIHTPRVSNGAPISTGKSMTASKGIIHMPSGTVKVRGTIEGHNPAKSSIGVSAIALSVANIVNPVPDVLVVALQPISKVNVECFRWAIAPWLIVGHAGVADWHHCPVAGRWVRLTPAIAAPTALGIDVGFIMNAV